jgi:hypothetical protein
MIQQEKSPAPRNADPLELATLLQILSAASNLVTLALHLPVVIDHLTDNDRIKDGRKWKSRFDQLPDRHEEYKRLTKEILLVFNEVEPQFGEKELKAGNLFSPIDRDRFYRLLDLKRDLALLSADMADMVNGLDKFVAESVMHGLPSERENALLLQFDRMVSLWGTGTFNQLARELKTLNRYIEKRIGYKSPAGQNQ